MRPGSTRQLRESIRVTLGPTGDRKQVAGATMSHHQVERAAYRASLDIRQRLAAADPANTEWQRDLLFVRERIDKLEEAAGAPG